MADNTGYTPGTGATIAADDVGGVLHQRVKLSVGSDGTAADADGGAGATTAATLRTVSATDDPGVAGIGGTADAAASAGGGGSLSAKLRLVTTQLANLLTTLATQTTLAAIDGKLPTLASGRLPVELDAAALSALETITVASVTAPLPPGSNNIGDVDVASLPSLPAGSNLIGRVQIDYGTPVGDVYVGSVLASAVAANKHHLSLYNADPAFKVDVLQVYVTKEVTAAVTGLIRGHRLFRFTTAHSAGTLVTARRLNTAMAAPDADVTVRAGSTVGGAEAEALAVVGVGEEETAANGGRLTLFDWREANVPITLNQNEGLTVQQDATAGTGLVSVSIVFRVR